MVLHRTAVRHAEVVRVERRENFYVSNVRGILGEGGIGRYTPDGSFVRLKNPLEVGLLSSVFMRATAG